jgi:UDP:flavonoid glycosyltransferase YjiC (YdhE family)
MPRSLRVLITSVGSHGDINPYIALAAALKARGHQPTLLINEYFHQQAMDEDIECVPLGERIDLKELLETPGAMHPIKAPMVVVRELVLPIVQTMVRRVREEVRRIKADVVLSHAICIGSTWACEMEGVPRVACNLAPIGWFNPSDKVVASHLRSFDPSPRAVRFDMWFGKLVMNFLCDRPLNHIRRELGLPKGKGWFGREFTQGALAIGLWSPLFRPPLEGDPAGSIVTGFPWHDRHREITPKDDRLHRFLDECERDGEPPILFSLGTAAVHTHWNFYQHAADACRLLKRRGLLLVGRAEYTPTNLPPGTQAFTYAPFSEVMPRCAVNVHHAGIGSTAQGLRAGRPTVAVPLAHDQHDNAARLKRLGVSDTVPHTKVTPKTLAKALESVLNDPAIAAHARTFREPLLAEDGAMRVTDELERRWGG